MKRDLVDDFFTPVNDASFGAKFAMVLLGTITSSFLVGAPAVFGYMAQVIRHAQEEKEGLADLPSSPWKMYLEGCTCLLSALYCLPGAILIAFSLIVKAQGGGSGFLSVSSALANFILIGGGVVFLGGLAFTISSLYGYLSSKDIKAFFDIPSVLGRIKSHSGELTALLVAMGVLYFLIGLLGLVLPKILLVVISAVVSSYLCLVVALRTGSIFSEKPELTTEDTTQASIDAVATDKASVPAATEDALESDSEDNVWRPK